MKRSLVVSQVLKMCVLFLVRCILEHVVSTDGIRLDSVKIEAICGLTRPTTVTEM